MPKRKILLVDDEMDFIKIMSERIKQWGYEVIASLSGREAIPIVKSKKPDLLILDYKMADMDGIATLKEIRKINKKIPVIMFTAYPNEKSIQESEKFGISAYVPKLSAYSDSHDNLRSAIKMAEKTLKKESMERRI
ncbi:MAG: response regulator [Candidatus Omnitrophica bacterium]|nr:response regulator [Candidatus Omnitrophota bacterium]MBL7210452.1 response regulator [Candidatus Omnitrophota bacterium]